MLQRSFAGTVYHFQKVPPMSYRGNFGVYVHIPFCRSKCSFCPFYKEVYSEEACTGFLEAIVREIEESDIEGAAKWVYFGGGTPNILPIHAIVSIKNTIGRKLSLEAVGIELLPALIQKSYLQELAANGFTKISIGIESFSREILRTTGRTLSMSDNYREMVAFAQSRDMWVNTDLIVGLPDQQREDFLDDIRQVRSIRPDQVTIYPLMTIRGAKPQAGIPSGEQFCLIEEASELLAGEGYTRKNIWTYALGDGLYDSSADELVDNYIGFGPSAFSTWERWKVVNPPLDKYAAMLAKGERMGLVAAKSKATDDWRQFARMVYDLKGHTDPDLPGYVNAVIALLRRARYVSNGTLTSKGRKFAHTITKTVVESLPFPIQNPGCVDNWEEYETYGSHPGA